MVMQLSDPWIGGARRRVNGSTVSSIVAYAAPMSGHAQRFQRSASVFATTAKTTAPAAIPCSCRRR